MLDRLLSAGRDGVIELLELGLGLGQPAGVALFTRGKSPVGNVSLRDPRNLRKRCRDGCDGGHRSVFRSVQAATVSRITRWKLRMSSS